MTVLSLINASASPEVQMNEAIQAIDPLVVFSYDQANSGGLNVSIRGGMWDGIDLASQIVALTANTTNYIVANRATGAASASTATTNWNDYPSYVRLHLAVAGATTLASIKDWRVSANGVFAINQIEIEDQIVNGVVDKAPSQNAVFDALALKVNLAGDQTLTGVKTFEHVIVGNAGTEGTGIDVNGTEYQSTFKVTDINGTHLAQSIWHKHSTSIAPLQLFARSNSNDNTHANVTNSMPLAQRFAAGYAGSNYKLFGYDEILVDSAGIISNTSAPGAYKLWLTPNGSLTPVNVLSATATAVSTSVNFNGATPTEIGYLSGVTSAIQTQLNARVLTSSVGAANGVCELDSNSLVPTNRLPSYVDDVLEYANLAGFPVTGETGKIYVAIDTNKQYRWSGSVYVQITSGAVDSVFGRTGLVTAQSGDYTAAQVGALSNATNSTQSGYFGNIYLQDDSTPSHYLEVTAGSNLTANRTLTLLTGDADRTLTFTGDASISGTNTGDQSSIVGISGTMAQFDTACSDGNFMYKVTSTDNAITRFDGASGAVQNSGVSIDDSNNLYTPSNVSIGSSANRVYISGYGHGTGSAAVLYKLATITPPSSSNNIYVKGSIVVCLTAESTRIDFELFCRSNTLPSLTSCLSQRIMRTTNALEGYVRAYITTSGTVVICYQSDDTAFNNIGIKLTTFERGSYYALTYETTLGAFDPTGSTEVTERTGTGMYFSHDVAFGVSQYDDLSARVTMAGRTSDATSHALKLQSQAGAVFLNARSDGCIGIGAASSSSSRLVIAGSTSDNTATALLVENSSGTDIFAVRNDSNVFSYGTMVFPKTQGAWVKVDTANPRSPWRDITCELNVRTAGGAAPTNAAFRGGRCQALFFNTNNEIEISVHIPHDYVMGTNIYLHPHWGHNGTAISGSLVIDYYHTYSKGHNGDIFPAEKQLTQTLSGLNLTNTPRYSHRVDDIQISTSGGSATLIDSSLLEPDGIIRITAVVSTIPTITGGSRNEPYIMNVDMHYMSTELGTVERTPNFWV